MSFIDCYQIGTLLSREEARQSEADRLQIEAHRSGCERCRGNASFDDALRRLADEVPPRPSSRAIERAIASALAMPATAPPSRLRPPLFIGAAVAMAAAAAIAFFVVRGQGSVPLAFDVGPPPADATEVLALGEARRLAHAQVTATIESSYSWRDDSRQLVLDRGALHVEVTPNTGRSFTVETPSFDVFVVGTAFDVDLEGVRVERGVVEVRAKSGELIAPPLTAGQSWLASELAATDGIEPLDEADSDDADEADEGDEGDDADEADEADVEGGDLEILEPEPTKSAADWLARATKQIRQQRFPAARRSITLALAAGPTAREKAEALTLRAELALVTGNVGEAIGHYRKVASRYRRSPLGEAALFAAARLEAKRGKDERARKLLLLYQERYPAGRFRREVKSKLRALGVAP